MNQIFGVMWLQSTRTSKMILADKDLTSALAPAYPTAGIVAHIGLESSWRAPLTLVSLGSYGQL